MFVAASVSLLRLGVRPRRIVCTGLRGRFVAFVSNQNSLRLGLLSLRLDQENCLVNEEVLAPWRQRLYLGGFQVAFTPLDCFIGPLD